MLVRTWSSRDRIRRDKANKARSTYRPDGAFSSAMTPSGRIERIDSFHHECRKRRLHVPMECEKRARVDRRYSPHLRVSGRIFTPEAQRKLSMGRSEKVNHRKSGPRNNQRADRDALLLAFSLNPLVSPVISLKIKGGSLGRQETRKESSGREVCCFRHCAARESRRRHRFRRAAVGRPPLAPIASVLYRPRTASRDFSLSPAGPGVLPMPCTWI